MRKAERERLKGIAFEEKLERLESPAMKYIRDVIYGKEKHPNQIRVNTCWRVMEIQSKRVKKVVVDGGERTYEEMLKDGK